MRTLRLMFWFVIGLAIVALALPVFAAEIKVPHLANAAERSYVGTGFYLSDGTSVGNRPDLAEEIVFRLYVENGVQGLRDSDGNLIPQVIEIRAYIPNTPVHLLPLERLIWDADGDGLADYAAAVIGEDDAGEPEFMVITITKPAKPPMAEIWFFRIPLPETILEISG